MTVDNIDETYELDTSTTILDIYEDMYDIETTDGLDLVAGVITADTYGIGLTDLAGGNTQDYYGIVRQEGVQIADIVDRQDRQIEFIFTGHVNVEDNANALRIGLSTEYNGDLYFFGLVFYNTSGTTDKVGFYMYNLSDARALTPLVLTEISTMNLTECVAPEIFSEGYYIEVNMRFKVLRLVDGATSYYAVYPFCEIYDVQHDEIDVLILTKQKGDDDILAALVEGELRPAIMVRDLSQGTAYGRFHKVTLQ
jgi:hypothetical protein